MKVPILLIIFIAACTYAQIQDLPVISGADSLLSTQTGEDYNGDGATEIITCWMHRITKKIYVGVYSFKLNSNIYSSLSFDSMPLVISGDFSGDKQCDIAVEKKIVVFKTIIGTIDKKVLFNTVAIRILPNPFSKSAHIQFMLTRDSKVRITIYDLHGKLVNELYSGTLKQGPQSFSWDIDKKNSAVVANSKYIVEISTDDYSSYEMITCVQ